MTNPDKIFKDKLYDIETPLSGNVSFENVMAMRKTTTPSIWWKPALLVVATLSLVSLTGFLINSNSKPSLIKGIFRGYFPSLISQIFNIIFFKKIILYSYIISDNQIMFVPGS